MTAQVTDLKVFFELLKKAQQIAFDGNRLKQPVAGSCQHRTITFGFSSLYSTMTGRLIVIVMAILETLALPIFEDVRLRVRLTFAGRHRFWLAAAKMRPS
jgi:hypothetical protein